MKGLTSEKPVGMGMSLYTIRFMVAKAFSPANGGSPVISSMMVQARLQMSQAVVVLLSVWITSGATDVNCLLQLGVPFKL